MEKRRFGKTGHESTVAIFGAAAFWEVSQAQADRTMELVISSGINHIDVAPSYGQAEERIGPWMEKERDRFFLGCKTMERTRQGAASELHQSLKRLKTDQFDLYQFHAVNSMTELDQITRTGGALEAFEEARRQGLIVNIGITGHGLEIPIVLLEAMKRFKFESVLFPLNFILFANPEYRKNAELLLYQCKEHDLGVMIIKSIARGPWGGKPQTNTTWYQPFTTKESIRKAINFVLSQPVTGICTAGDVALLPEIFKSCEDFVPQSITEQEELVSHADEFEPIFT